MAETKAFPAEYVFTVITGVLMAPDSAEGNGIGGVYEILNWMTDESVFTHQLPRISREATPVIVEMHPTLQQAIDEAGQITPENWREWRDRWIDRYGPEIVVPKMTTDQHERIDPLSELVEKVHPDRIIQIAPKDAD